MEHDKEDGMTRSLQTRREFVTAAAAGVGAAIAGASTARPLRAAGACQTGRQIGFAVAGIGNLATNQVLPALRATRFARPTGLITRSPERVLPLATEYGIPPDSIYTYDDMDRMRGDPSIRAVYVATPNGLHRDHTVDAARAGKHVLCEKPMAISVAECEEMIAACDDAGVKLAIGYRLQFEAHHVECIRLARDGAFGALTMIEAGFGFRIGDPSQWRLRMDLAGGGPLMDVGIYALQACRYLTGEEPIEVVAFESKTDPVTFAEVEESLVWQMTFPGGCLASCSTSYNLSGMNRFRAYGPRGWLGLEPAYGYGGIEGHRSDGAPLDFPHVDHFVTKLDDFARCILEDRQSKVDGMEGLRDMRAIEDIYESARAGRSVRLD
jgi:predicted dehydrogenase